jgi:hypothetical protein
MTKPSRRFRGGSVRATGPHSVEAIAAQLGITRYRVLLELGRIAFADIRRVVRWDTQNLTMIPADELHKTDAAAIAEIVASAKDARIYRIKMHDKPSALMLLGRCLTMSPPSMREGDDAVPPEVAEGLRDELDRQLARLAASLEEEAIPSIPDSGAA